MERASAQGGQEGSRPETSGTGPPMTTTGANEKDKLEDEEVKAKEPGTVGRATVEKPMECLSEAEVRKREKREKRMAEQLGLKMAAERAAFKKNQDDIKRSEDFRRKYAEEDRKKREAEDEERRKVEEARKKAAEGQQSINGGASNTQGGGEGDGASGADETPRYLARLLSELITGVADPAGPHRPSQDGASGNGEMPSGEAAMRSSNEAASEKKSSNGGGGGGGGVAAGVPGENNEGGTGEPPRRSFAERYAGPEGTTVTIAAAPSPSFGLRMEGPSLSIKNPGAGAEPEVSGAVFAGLLHGRAGNNSWPSVILII